MLLVVVVVLLLLFALGQHETVSRQVVAVAACVR